MNVLKNSSSSKGSPVLHERALFVDGDFESAGKALSEKVGDHQYDLILTAESIYNHNSALQLLEAFDACLTPDGDVLVAAKSYYFGVGGSIASFKRLAEQDGRFVCPASSSIDDGKSNKREILLLRRISPSSQTATRI